MILRTAVAGLKFGQLSYPELVPAGGPTRCSQIQAWFGLVKLGKETSTVATLGDLPGPEYTPAPAL